jgi:hypothetical protein
MPLTRQTKRKILDTLLMQSEPIEGDADLMSFLNRVWPLDEMPSEDHRFRNAAGDIHKHIVMNDDLTVEELYVRRLHLFDGTYSLGEESGRTSPAGLWGGRSVLCNVHLRRVRAEGLANS